MEKKNFGGGELAGVWVVALQGRSGGGHVPGTLGEFNAQNGGEAALGFGEGGGWSS